MKLYNKFKRDLLTASRFSELSKIFNKIDEMHNVFVEWYSAILTKIHNV